MLQFALLVERGLIMQNRYFHQRGPSEFKVAAYMVVVMVLVYVFVITWPASLAFVLVLSAWLLTGKSLSPMARSIHEAALPVLIGTGVFWAASLVMSLWSQISEGNRQSLFQAEQWLLEARRDVHVLSGPNLTIYLLLLAVLLAWLYFFPESRAIGRILHAKKEVARLHLCLLALTSFTMFGGSEADKLARDDHNRELQNFKISLRAELKSAQKFLATKMAEDAVGQSLRVPIPLATKARLVYLVQTVQGPAYKAVRLQREFGRNMPPNERTAWEFKHGLDS